MGILVAFINILLFLSVSICFSQTIHNKTDALLYIYGSNIHFKNVVDDELIDSIRPKEYKVINQSSLPLFLKFASKDTSITGRYFNVSDEDTLSIHIKDNELYTSDYRESSNQNIDSLRKIVSNSNQNLRINTYLDFISRIDSNFYFDELYFMQESIYYLNYSSYLKLVMSIDSCKNNLTFYEVNLLMFLKEIIISDFTKEEKKNLFNIISSRINDKRNLKVVEYLKNQFELEYGEISIGKKIIDEYRLNKNEIIYFTASWCPPCEAAIDSVNEAIEIINNIDSLNITIFAMESSVEDFINYKKKYKTENIFFLEGGGNNSIAEYFSVNILPSLILIKDYRIQNRNWISPQQLPVYFKPSPTQIKD